MAGDLDICNLALSHIGKEQIQAMDQKGAAAEQCRLHFTPALHAALASFDWSFARMVKTLPALSGYTFSYPYAYAFTLPADCLRVRDIEPISPHEPRDQRRFKIGRNPLGDGRVIYTVRAAPVFVYTTSNIDLASIDDQFVECFSYHLAAKLAMPLTRDLKIRAEMMKWAINLTGQAQAASANEGDTTPQQDPDWIVARG